MRDTSHKPDEIYGLIERLSPGTRKVGMLVLLSKVPLFMVVFSVFHVANIHSHHKCKKKQLLFCVCYQTRPDLYSCVSITYIDLAQILTLAYIGEYVNNNSVER